MKKLLPLLLCVPLIGLGQTQIVKIKPTPLLLGDLVLSYEREIVRGQSFTVGIPLYVKRDIAKMKSVQALSQSLAPLFSEDASKNDVEDILDDAEGIGDLSGYGIVLKYKKYLNKDTSSSLTGFYFSPQYYFKKFNIKIDASQSDLRDIYHNDNSPIDFPTENYELDGDIKINTFSLNFGHQWIKNQFAIDIYIGLAHYNISYAFEEESGSYENDEDDDESIWLPRTGLNLGIALP